MKQSSNCCVSSRESRATRDKGGRKIQPFSFKTEHTNHSIICDSKHHFYIFFYKFQSTFCCLKLYLLCLFNFIFFKNVTDLLNTLKSVVFYIIVLYIILLAFYQTLNFIVLILLPCKIPNPLLLFDVCMLLLAERRQSAVRGLTALKKSVLNV